METKPAFTFVGYHLESLKYVRKDEEEVSEILFSILGTNFDSEKRFFLIDSKLELKFETTTSEFIFSSGYQINPKFLINEEEIEKALPFMMSSVFPYIRTHVQNVTSDSRGPIVIPTIDLRGINVQNGISLKKRNTSKKK